MSATLKSLRALSDPTRLRIVALLERDELSVNELQEITRLGQSRISTHLGLLSDCALVQSRREGKRTFYKLNPQVGGDTGEFIQLAIRGAKELPEHGGDQINLKRILARRREQAQVYFNQVAGRFDRVYGPGRSWQAFGHLLLRILPPLVVADLGAGEGLLSELLARRCKKVIAVDNSEKIVAFGAAKARKNGLKNLEFRLGDLQNPPIEPGSVDLVILSQALHHAEVPADAIVAAHKILPAARADFDSRFVEAQLRQGARTLRRPLARFCRERSTPLAGRSRVQEDRNQRGRPRGPAAAFPDHSGERGKIISREAREEKFSLVNSSFFGRQTEAISKCGLQSLAILSKCRATSTRQPQQRLGHFAAIRLLNFDVASPLQSRKMTGKIALVHLGFMQKIKEITFLYCPEQGNNH